MNARIVIRPEAEQDMADARDWYEDQRDGLGVRFLLALDEVCDRIAATPELVPPEYRSVRRLNLPRFPYVVYYRLVADFIEVIAVLHGSRDPQGWQSRA